MLSHSFLNVKVVSTDLCLTFSSNYKGQRWEDVRNGDEFKGIDYE